MRALICGSLAFDTIMVFHDQFKNHILPDRIHILNVAFLVPDMRREFGGTAGNIAYNLRMLGGEPVMMATVGDDFGPYADRLDRLGIGREHVRTVSDTYTAQAFITTDLSDNQITAFHPGAMNHAHENRVADAAGIRIGIVAPDGRQGMIEHAAQFADAGIPFIFDPGQAMTLFGGPELAAFVEQATWVTVNDYEGEMLAAKTGRSPAEIAGEVSALILTRGAAGSVIFSRGERIEIPCVSAESTIDPTGCGDAYRAGLLYGIMQGMDWPTTGRLAAVMGAIKIAHRGGQNHRASRPEIEDRFRDAFGYRFN